MLKGLRIMLLSNMTNSLPFHWLVSKETWPWIYWWVSDSVYSFHSTHEKQTENDTVFLEGVFLCTSCQMCTGNIRRKCKCFCNTAEK